jgi:hypothetical protein
MMNERTLHAIDTVVRAIAPVLTFPPLVNLTLPASFSSKLEQSASKSPRKILSYISRADISIAHKY